ncbi:MAG: hypothetical protein J7619_09840 [Dyadobacter sp.]|uniref:hypothetical protein n=1 Tax=Dyadobacter sp. TaxID=1914288 RepID=UPI001B2A62C5|nr:hypothetical protein [Dyadobacter sp.]MBO9612986.1 hypothetical protein [Dyadobacter sp.]
MQLKPIKSEAEYDQFLEWIDSQFDAAPAPDSSEGNMLQIALLLVKAYEDEHYSVPAQVLLD